MPSSSVPRKENRIISDYRIRLKKKKKKKKKKGKNGKSELTKPTTL
jgi:hypothetical protein